MTAQWRQSSCDAIETIRAVVTRAVGGDDPFLLKGSTVELCFAVTKDGSITLGFNGELSNEVTHTLRIGSTATRPGGINTGPPV